MKTVEQSYLALWVFIFLRQCSQLVSFYSLATEKTNFAYTFFTQMFSLKTVLFSNSSLFIFEHSVSDLEVY